MKQIVYCVVDTGENGHTDKIVFASLFDTERNHWYAQCQFRDRCYPTEQIYDLKQVALDVWKTLDAVQKMSLLNLDCPMWDKDFEDSSVSTAHI